MVDKSLVRSQPDSISRIWVMRGLVHCIRRFWSMDSCFPDQHINEEQSIEFDRRSGERVGGAPMANQKHDDGTFGRYDLQSS